MTVISGAFVYESTGASVAFSSISITLSGHLSVDSEVVNGDERTVNFTYDDGGTAVNDGLKPGSNDITITAWGGIPLSRSESIFYLFPGSITTTGVDVPTILPSTSFYRLFRDASTLASADFGNIGNWDVSNVTSFQEAFYGCTNFNQDISGWDTSSATRLTLMFAGGLTAFNQPIGSWDISNVTLLNFTFATTSAFNQSLDSWDVTGVTSFEGIFSGGVYNSTISSWTLTSATRIDKIFKDNSTFNNNSLNSWDVSGISNFDRIFNNATAFNQDITMWDLSSATNLSQMFDGASAFDQNVKKWIVATPTVTNMFANATAMAVTYGSDGDYGNTPNLAFFNDCVFSTITITDSDGDVNLDDLLDNTDNNCVFSTIVGPDGSNNYTLTYRHFVDASSNDGLTFQNQSVDITAFGSNAYLSRSGNQFRDYTGTISASDAPIVQSNSSLASCFRDSTVTTVPFLSSWDTSGATDMSSMFNGATSFNQSLTGIDTSSATDISNMFNGATAFDGSVSGWDVSNVTNFNYCFNAATAFTGVGLSTWVTSSGTDMKYMFTTCTSLLSDGTSSLSSWDVADVTDFSGMFSGSIFNGNISSWTPTSATTFYFMFNNSSFSQNLSSWNVSSSDNFQNMFAGTSFATDITGWSFKNGTVVVSRILSSTSSTDDIYTKAIIKLESVITTDSVTLGTISAKINTEAGLTARNNLISRGWVIYDDGTTVVPSIEPGRANSLTPSINNKYLVGQGAMPMKSLTHEQSQTFSHGRQIMNKTLLATETSGSKNVNGGALYGDSSSYLLRRKAKAMSGNYNNNAILMSSSAQNKNDVQSSLRNLRR